MSKGIDGIDFSKVQELLFKLKSMGFVLDNEKNRSNSINITRKKGCKNYLINNFSFDSVDMALGFLEGIRSEQDMKFKEES